MKALYMVMVLSVGIAHGQMYEVEWQRSFDLNSSDYLLATLPARDGGCIMTGWSASADDTATWFLKCTGAGEVAWSRPVNFGARCKPRAVAELANENFACAGENWHDPGRYDYWYGAVDSLGEILYSHALIGPRDDLAYAVATLQDRGLVFGGKSYGEPDYLHQLWIVRTDAEGDTLWSTIVDASRFGEIGYLEETDDGGIVFAGNRRDIDTPSTLLFGKLNAAGNPLWIEEFSEFERVEFLAACRAHGGGYILLGNASSGIDWDRIDFVIGIRVDDQGNEIWRQNYGTRHFYDMTPLSEGGYMIVASVFDVGIELQYMDEDGNLLTAAAVAVQRADTTTYPVSITENDSGEVFVGCQEGYDVFGQPPIYETNYFLIKFSRTLSSGSTPEQAETFRLCNNYPNPFNPTTTISYSLANTSAVTLSVFDILGKQVEVLIDETQPAGAHEILFDGSALPSGIYFSRLQASEFVQTQKMVLLK